MLVYEDAQAYNKTATHTIVGGEPDKMVAAKSGGGKVPVREANKLTDAEWKAIQARDGNAVFFRGPNPVLVAHGAACKWATKKAAA